VVISTVRTSALGDCLTRPTFPSDSGGALNS
jgi:hypothetical protein